MKKNAYTDLICKGFCSFYKEGKEELTCGTYDFLERNLTLKELEAAVLGLDKTPDYSSDEYIMRVICSRCAFLEGDCDFRLGLDSPACGGYVIIESLTRLRRAF